MRAEMRSVVSTWADTLYVAPFSGSKNQPPPHCIGPSDVRPHMIVRSHISAVLNAGLRSHAIRPHSASLQGKISNAILWLTIQVPSGAAGSAEVDANCRKTRPTIASV